MKLELKIRAFRAIDDKLTRNEYHKSLEQVLLYYGITRVTSQSSDWFDDPDTWIIVVQSVQDGQILGGARMQRASANLPLPMEKAIAFKDTRIYDEVNKYIDGGLGELCGLWNSRKVAGMGIGSIFLGISAISIATRINMGTVMCLCAPSTKANCLRTGFTINKNLGTTGEFIYPKENLVATALIMEDPINVPHAQEFERSRILKIRENPKIELEESTPKGEILLHFDL